MAASWIELGFAPPSWATTAISAVGQATTAVATLADLASTTARTASAFAISIEEPTKAIADAIKREVDALADDILKAGGYTTGDWDLVRYPFKELKGGYPLFEQRMVARILDQDDPTRPAFSPSSVVTAVFLYTESPDASGLDQVVTAIKGLASMLRQPVRSGAGPLPVPLAVTVVPEPPDAEAPAAFRVRWRTSQSSPVPPGGYLISISTTRDPLRARVFVPSASVPPAGLPPADSYPILDAAGTPIQLFGGFDQIPDSTSTGAGDGATIKEDALTTVLVAPDGTLLSPGAFTPKNKRHVGQRTFRVGTVLTAAQWPTGHFSTVLKRSDFPVGWDVPTPPDKGHTAKVQVDGEAAAYYVRVAPVASKVASGEAGWVYDLDKAAEQARIGKVPAAPLPAGLSPDVLGPWSAPALLRMPGPGTAGYRDAVTAALAVTVLTRSDLRVDPEAAGSAAALVPTGLESVAARVVSLLGAKVVGWSLKTGADPRAYRAALWAACDRVAADIVARADLPPKTASALAQQALTLRTVRVADLVREAGESEAAGALQAAGLGDATILDLLRPSSAAQEQRARAWIAAGADGQLPPLTPTVSMDQTCGVCPSPQSPGMSAELAVRAVYTPGVVRLRAPHFPSGEAGKSTEQVVEYAAPADAPLLIASSSPGVAAVYKRYTRIDGSIKLPKQEADRLRKLLATPVSVTGAAAQAPVLAVRSDVVRSAAVAEDLSLDPKKKGGAGLLCLRTLLATGRGGAIVREAATVLAATVLVASKPRASGAWHNVRLADVVPGLDIGLRAASQWLGSASRAATGVGEATKSYLDAATRSAGAARGLADRLGAAANSIIAGAIPLPNLSVLVVSGRGTGGVMAELLGAAGKPQSLPGSYGGGAVLLVGGAPGFLFDILGISTGSPSLVTSGEERTVI